jgi:hypothetical protein
MHIRRRRWHPAPQLPPMPPGYAALYQEALRARHAFFASRKGRRYNVALARNRAIWNVRGWLKHYREGRCDRQILKAIAHCMATVAVLSSRN